MSSTVNYREENEAPAVLPVLSALDAFESPSSFLDTLERMAGGRPVVLSFLNHHAVNLAIDDADFRGHLLAADLLLRDGIGVAIACRFLGFQDGADLNGADLIPLILERLKGRRVMLCGASEPWLGEAARRLANKGHKIVGAIDGFQDFERYRQAVNEARPDILVLGMGMPRQEALASRLEPDLHAPMLIINGGAIIDFLGGRFPRAPIVWRRLRLEWLFRLLQEPGRLAGRHLLGIPVFFGRLVRARLFLRSAA